MSNLASGAGEVDSDLNIVSRVAPKFASQGHVRTCGRHAPAKVRELIPPADGPLKSSGQPSRARRQRLLHCISGRCFTVKVPQLRSAADSYLGATTRWPPCGRDWWSHSCPRGLGDGGPCMFCVGKTKRGRSDPQLRRRKRSSRSHSTRVGGRSFLRIGLWRLFQVLRTQSENPSLLSRHQPAQWTDAPGLPILAFDCCFDHRGSNDAAIFERQQRGV